MRTWWTRPVQGSIGPNPCQTQAHESVGIVPSDVRGRPPRRGVRAGAGEPDRRAHRLQRGTGAPSGARRAHHGRGRSRRGRRAGSRVDARCPADATRPAGPPGRGVGGVRGRGVARAGCRGWEGGTPRRRRRRPGRRRPRLVGRAHRRDRQGPRAAGARATHPASDRRRRIPRRARSRRRALRHHGSDHRCAGETEPRPAHRVRHGLAAGALNRRRSECEAAVARLRLELPELKWLAAWPVAWLARLKRALPEPLRARAVHVVGETARTRFGAQLLARGRLKQFGRLLYESHESCRRLYECSAAELDLVVAAAKRAGALGARLTGAGWGGAVLVLVERKREARITAGIRGAFARAYGREPPITVVRAAGGVRRESVR